MIQAVLKNLKKKIFQNRYEAVCGSRFLKTGKYIYGSSYQRFLLSYYGTKIVNFILGLNFTDATGGYICISSKVAKRILKKAERRKSGFVHTPIGRFADWQICQSAYQNCSKSRKFKINQKPIEMIMNIKEN